ncbi:MAG: cytochrome-c peroxidase [Rubrivivax sp.]
MKGRRQAWAQARAWCAGLLAGALVQAATAASPALHRFTPEEIERIVALGPWPPAPVRDPGNALSGRPEAAAFGKRLFSDRRLSPAGVSCAHCHRPQQDFADGRARSRGVAELDRHAPSLWNAVHERWQGWDGAADSLWAQAIRPLLDPREMASSPGHLQALLQSRPADAAAWKRVFGRGVREEDSQAVLVGTAKLLAAYVATLVSPRTPFDDFRDALARGDLAAARRYPLAAQRGLQIFVGRGNCHLCHGGPRFTHGEFADIGLPFFTRPGVVDSGRHGGIEALRASPYTLLSPWADPPEPGQADEAVKTRHVQATHRQFGEFKVPGLRQVARTAPYMHDGQLATLEDVVRHYSELKLERLHADGEQVLRPLRLSARESQDLLAFLRSLTAPNR